MNEATAFLLERSGAVLDALKLYIQVIRKFLIFLNFNSNKKNFTFLRSSKLQFRKPFVKLKKGNYMVINSSKFIKIN